MKIKTNKLKKLEKNRKSILTDNLEFCYICGNVAVDVHEIYSGCNRRMSMIHDCCVPLCRSCHATITYDARISNQLKQECQKRFEEEYSREEFMKAFGRSWL